jgi:hypothetical protein
VCGPYAPPIPAASPGTDDAPPRPLAHAPAVANILLLALAAAFYPTLLAIVIVVLQRPRPARLLAAYLAGGMLISLGIGLAVVFVLEGVGANRGGESTTRTGAVVDIAVGAVALCIAAAIHTGRDLRPTRLRKRRAPNINTGPKKPSWAQRAIGHDSLKVAFGLGVVLDLPSVWYLIALKDIVNGSYSAAEEFLLVLVFNVIMFALIEVPLIAYLVAPERAAGIVDRFNAWIRAHGRRIMEGVAAVFGVYLVVKGAVAL